MTAPDNLDPPFLIHGTAVALNGRGLLFLGPSGSGKSALALRLIALGARLVADDQVLIRRGATAPIASAPPVTAGLIEARHLGILRLPFEDGVPLHLVADLGEAETQRLPARHSKEICGFAVPMVKASQIDHLAAALFCYLLGERQD